jgi:uncharacterized membrane protein YkvI
MGFLLLGLDSLIACIAISPLVSRWSHRLLLAALFGLADGIGFLIGVMVGVVSPLRMSGAFGETLEIALPAILGIYLIGIAILAVMTQRAGTQQEGTQRPASVIWPVWILPLILALDNFSFGLVGSPAAGSLLQQAFGQQAWLSALLALGGLLVGVAVMRAIPAMQRRAVAIATSGVGLVVLSIVLITMESME